jgi:stearoyl-CoA desaturase (Delta-9 desaturase)
MFKKLDFPAVFALIILPVIMIILGVNYVIANSLGVVEIILFVLGYYIANITVGIGLHRLWSHDTYKTNKYIEFVLSLLAAGTLQGPILSWASNHFKHHTYTDTDQDPHSPLKYKNRVAGFFWSHMGWMLIGEGSYKSINRVTMIKLGRNKILRWQLKYYWQLATLMNTVVPALVGIIIGWDISYAYAGFLFIGLGRALQQQITFFVNSLCHFVGTQKYTKGTSGDVWWLALLLLGENWHNFHHAFPSDYRNGAKWYQADVHKWIIYLMSKLGLAWDLKRTATVRVEARVSQTMEQFIKARKDQLNNMQSKVNELASLVQEKFSTIENSSSQMAANCQATYKKLQQNLSGLAIKLNQYAKDLNNPSEKIIKMINKEVQKAEMAVLNFYQDIEKIRQAV